MKKILFAAVAAMAITGCSQNEEIEKAAQPVEIGFGTIVKTTTRAVVTNKANLGDFKVHSYITGATYDGTALGDAYMNGVLYKTSDNLTWTKDAGDTKTYYWPSASDKSVQFFAYPSTLVTDFSAPATGYPSFTYTMATTVADQKDLVVAHEQNKTATSEGVNNGSLTLGFKHILSRINFAYVPSRDDLTYTVSAIKIAGITGGKAKYSFNATNGEWTPDPTDKVSQDYVYTVTQSPTRVTDKNYYLLGYESASLILFPQDVTGIVITVTYKSEDADGMTVFSGDKTVTLPANSKWEVGQNVLYILTLPAGGTEMTVVPAVSDWGDADDEENDAK